eukprot:gb/GECH01006128.1/.p1 GENE.gb/GECH01006128.1/~~gb/GECH01006128.1/.p1  ORF type:complete len:158 (+),score=31.05 gb/GECH01006128.1/:1-474(+)
MKELQAFQISEEGLRDTLVPSREPITPEQTKACQRLWPIKVHPPPHPHRVDAIPDRVLLQMSHFMEMALNRAEDSMQCGGCGVGAVIVDPQSDKVVAAAGDTSPPDMSPYWINSRDSTSSVSHSNDNINNDNNKDNQFDIYLSIRPFYNIHTPTKSF